MLFASTRVLRLSLLGALLGIMTSGLYAQQFKKIQKAPVGTVVNTGFPSKTVQSYVAPRPSGLTLPATRPTPRPAGVRELVYGPEGPIFLKTDAPARLLSDIRSLTPAEQTGRNALAHLRGLGLTGLPTEVSLLSHNDDELGFSHIRMQQTYQGLPVYGADMYVHLTPDNELVFNGRYQHIAQPLNVIPVLDAEEAVNAATEELSKHMHVRIMKQEWKSLLKYETVPATLMIYPMKGQVANFRLAYQVTMRPSVMHRHEVFIDAVTGELLNDFDHTCSIHVVGTATDLTGATRQINVFRDTDGTHYTMDINRDMYTGSGSGFPEEGEGVIFTLDMNNTSLDNPSFFYIQSNNANSWDPKEVSAHYNGGEAYAYFENTFSRSAIDGNGGDIFSLINVPDENGQPMDNAFWNGVAMFYGNGNQAFTAPLAAALDVAGHEMSHGVIEKTANLVYQDEPGALNESFADVFGVMIDRDDWTLAEGICNTSFFPTGAMRDMANPNNGGTPGSASYQPDHVSDQYLGNEDNGGVHINSGIPNHAFYLFATAIGKGPAEQVYYRALSQYLTRSSQFKDCRTAVIQAATDLHGANSNQVAQAAAAFDAVGIVGSGGNSGPVDIETNPGQEFIISANSDASLAQSWYISDPNPVNYLQASSITPLSKISVTDDGNFGYFTGQDGNLYEVNVDPNDGNFTQFFQLTTDNAWRNVAVSKDGKRLAAVTNQADATIYIFNVEDWNNVTQQVYNLYIPTTGQGGVNTGGVVSADALAWDPAGEFLMYDSYNVITGTLGDTIDYWDISFLSAWNSSTNTYGDGAIFKLFSTLDPGVNVGNPVFSKNSPFIIAFDYFDVNTNEYLVLGANLETNDVQIIAQNNTLGFPEYSTNDDKVIYNYFASNRDFVRVVNLQSNKIQGNGNPSELIPDGYWGVWYATGDRVLISVEDPVLGAQWRAFPVPAQDKLWAQYSLNKIEPATLSLIDMTGRICKEKTVSAQLSNTGTQTVEMDLSDLVSGVYLLQIQVGSEVLTQRVIKD